MQCSGGLAYGPGGGLQAAALRVSGRSAAGRPTAHRMVASSLSAERATRCHAVRSRLGSVRLMTPALSRLGSAGSALSSASPICKCAWGKEEAEELGRSKHLSARPSPDPRWKGQTASASMAQTDCRGRELLRPRYPLTSVLSAAHTRV